MEYSERHEKFPNTVILSYPFRWGGQLADRWMWLAELNGEAWDYDAKHTLIKKAITAGYPVVVLRCHRSGGASVVRNLTPYAADRDPHGD